MVVGRREIQNRIRKLLFMSQRLAPRAGSNKVLASLAVASGLLFWGCSGEAERSDAANNQKKQVAETESKLLKQKGGKGARKGFGAPRASRACSVTWKNSKSQ